MLRSLTRDSWNSLVEVLNKEVLVKLVVRLTRDPLLRSFTRNLNKEFLVEELQINERHLKSIEINEKL